MMTMLGIQYFLLILPKGFDFRWQLSVNALAIGFVPRGFEFQIGEPGIEVEKSENIFYDCLGMFTKCFIGKTADLCPLPKQYVALLDAKPECKQLSYVFFWLLGSVLIAYKPINRVAHNMDKFAIRKVL